MDSTVCNAENNLIIPGRIAGWSSNQLLLKQLLSCQYGNMLMQEYKQLKTEYLYISPVHGIGHVERVMLFGALLAMLDGLSKADTVMLLRCCAYHDIGRMNDSYDEEHGTRSAEIILSGELSNLFDDCRTASAAIAAHSKPDRDSDSVAELSKVDDTDRYSRILTYLKDADNIDRVRLTDFDPTFLRHGSAKKVSEIAEWIFWQYEKKYTVLCFGDSNTYGFNPKNGGRYPEYIRWTSVLQRLLGRDYEVIAEGLNGRTTAFERDGIAWKSGLLVIESVLGTHYPIDSLIIMLGTNDCCASLNLDADEVTAGLERLVIAAWQFLDEKQGYRPRTILVSPPVLSEDTLNGTFGFEDNEKSLQVSSALAQKYKELSEKLSCECIDLEGRAEFSSIDGMHLTVSGHHRTAKILAGCYK